MNPVDLVLRVAAATEGAVESPPNSNAGPYVERVLKRTGLGKGHPWCAAWVADVGRLALGADWPLPMTASCYHLGEHARTKGALVTTPDAGDVFLVYFPTLKRFAHTGLVTEVLADGSVRTIEGNTNDGGSRDGWGVFRRTRRLGPNDRCIRWTALLPAPSSPALAEAA